MRVISLKTKLIGFALVILIICAAYFSIRKQAPILMVSGTSLTVQQIEQLCDSLIFTYKNQTTANITALNTQTSVTLIETNYNFPFVMNRSLLHGGFFRQEQYKHTVAVLNERAAFDIFGTIEATGNVLTLNKTIYAVIGVINDKDAENLNIYIPAGLLGDSVESLAINLAITPYPTEQIINKLMQAGIHYKDHRFINFAAAYTAVTDSIFLVVKLLAVFGLYSIIKKSRYCAKKQILVLQNLCREVYAVDLIKESAFWKLIGLSTIIASTTIVITILSVDVFRRILIIYDSIDTVIYIILNTI